MYSLVDSLYAALDSFLYTLPDILQSYFSPLSNSPTKWSNTLKQFVGNSRRIVRVHLTVLWG